MADFNAEQLKAVFNFDVLEKPVRTHLKNVYSCLAISMLSAALGGYVHLFTNLMQAGLLTFIGSIGLMLWLMATPHTKENQVKRLALLGGFAFFTGMGLGPLMGNVIRIEPSIIPMAFMATTLIFVCFSLSALLAEQRSFLYMGGMLFSALSLMMMLSFANIFLGSRMLYDVNLYLGLVVFSLFILFDTQLIVEKRRRGDQDYIWHSVDLFLDFIAVFRRLMVILGNKEQNKKRKN